MGKTHPGFPGVEQFSSPTMPTGAYVYAHRREHDGEVFYIGKGQRNRAWEFGRGDLWTHYIRTRSHGRYKVEILVDGLNNEKAIQIEDELIERFGEQLVNWINSKRQFEYSALEKFHDSRDDNFSFISQTRTIEVTNIEFAVARNREAIEREKKYNSLVLEKGLVADLVAERQAEEGLFSADDSTAIDRLTLLLMKMGRHLEVVDEVDKFLARYPLQFPDNHAVLKRRKAAADIAAGQLKPKNSLTYRQIKCKPVDEEELSKWLLSARSSGGAPFDWMQAAKICRQSGNLQREYDLLQEFMSLPRVPGRTWLRIERRFFIVKALLLEAGSND